MNIVGTGFAAILALGWLLAQVDTGHRRRLLEWTSNLRLLDSQEFEWLVGEMFRREGWTVEETGRPDAADGNVDLRLKRNKKTCVVQCKRWTSWPVGVDDIRAFAGTVAMEKGGSGIFVTLSTFTTDAQAEAKRAHIELVDRRALYARIDAVKRARPCPVCDAPMVLDRSVHGWWFRCQSRGCKGKADISRDPARAIEFLTSF